MIINFSLFIVFIFTLVIVTKVLGGYIFKVFNNKKTIIDWYAVPLENIYAKSIGTSLKKEQSAKAYFMSIVMFSVMSFVS